MKLLFLLLLLLASTYLSAQLSLPEVEDAAVVKRIEFVKANTDSFLLSSFKKDLRPKFEFEFVQGSYVYAGRPYNYVFLNVDKRQPDELSNVTHRYSFIDESIGLAAVIDIFFSQDQRLRFKSVEDAVKVAALKAIYNEGRLNKIKTRIKEEKLKEPYTTIEIDRTKKYRIFLKDRAGLHAYLIL
jgi:hypothetical protein